MKKLLITFSLSLFIYFHTSAKEGLWIPMLINQLNMAEMQNMGLKISAEEIYSINHSSIKDAIVLFGGGCTAEIISEQGLILTNHHCGISIVQANSTLENDYLNNGFWAMKNDEEIPAKGLTATIMIRMEDVTEKVLKMIDKNMTMSQKNIAIQQICNEIEKDAEKGTHYKAKVKSFYNGNKFYLIVNEIFKDVRLVGAPPVSIGKFGGDTDNWMWPRYTGDFCLFRIYTDKNNKPAAYSKENIPYKPRYSLKISLKGVQKDDFTFVYGYPGRTQEYIPSYAVNMTTGKENPVRINLREKKLNIINEGMKNSYKTRLQYTAKAASVANFWKKMIGENKGISRLNTINIKKAEEKYFNEQTLSGKGSFSQYKNLLSDYEKTYEQYEPIAIASDYFSEAGLGCDYIRLAYNCSELIRQCKNIDIPDSVIKSNAAKLHQSFLNFYNNTNYDVEIRIFKTLTSEYYSQKATPLRPPVFEIVSRKYQDNINLYLDMIINNSVFMSVDKVNKTLIDFKRKKYKQLENDPLFILSSSFYNFFYSDILPKLSTIINHIDSLDNQYMKAQMELYPDKLYYPDANMTLRIAYGKVEGYKPCDGVLYSHFTTLRGLMDREDTAVFDYRISEQLKNLYFSKDYGKYSDPDGEMHVCFIASNQTTGGNSGSPVLNGEGHLVGLNFDRVWEGTMSDLDYNPDLCRNISLDIRYCLFIIDKYAGARHLINEMKIVD